MAGVLQRDEPAATGAVDFRVLGPFEVWTGERPVTLSGRKQRALLALLALRAGQLVPKDVLVEELWGETPPRTARDALHNYVSLVRRAVGSDVLRTRDQGYVLDADHEHVDLLRFERLVKEAHDADSTLERAARLRRALDLWRGAPLSDLAYEPFVLRETPRLEALRLTARHALIEAELALGRAAELVPELEELVAANPFHERLHAQLMLALYRSGRQAEALEVYQRARRVLVELLGIDPGPELRQLEHAILCQSRDLDLDERVDGPHSARTLHRRQSGLKRAAAGPRSLRILERLEREARSRVLERLRSGSRESETLPLCTCGLSASREPGTTGLLWADARGEP